MAESIIIIGAGIAGLSAGCYGRMNGYDTRIFEMHDRPGGVCTSWKRKGYTFDGCIHWLVGSRDGSAFNRIWRELGALPGQRIVDHEEFVRIEGEGGKTLIVYTDEDRLERHMLELSPADAGIIEDFTGAIRLFKNMETPLEPPSTFEEFTAAGRGLPGLLRAVGPLRKFSRITIDEYAQGFKDPFLAEAFRLIIALPEAPVIMMAMTLAWMSARDAGYPVGGSLEFARAIERRYINLAGSVSYKSSVEKILVENDRAVGVRLVDGTEHRAGAVISAADGHATIFEMLEGKYVGEETLRAYTEWPLWDPLVQVSIGVDRDLSGEPHTVRFPLEDPIDAGGKVTRELRYKHFCFDSTMAPQGKSAVVVFLASDFEHWNGLVKDPDAYKAEKERVAGEVITALEGRLPGFREQVEVVDVATPTTTVRYTGNWRGSFEGWSIDRQTSRYMVRSMKRTLPGLDDFYMAGQWVTPGGGLPTAALAGRQAVRAICRKDCRKFTANRPE